MLSRRDPARLVRKTKPRAPLDAGGAGPLAEPYRRWHPPVGLSGLGSRCRLRQLIVRTHKKVRSKQT